MVQTTPQGSATYITHLYRNESPNRVSEMKKTDVSTMLHTSRHIGFIYQFERGRESYLTKQEQSA